MRSVIVASITIALLATVSLSGCRGMEETPSVDPASTLDCDELAHDAKLFSRSMRDNPRLVKVRNPTLVNDHRDAYTTPTGSAQALILECEGVGVWSNGSNSMVSLRLTIDSEGQPYIDYQPK